MTDTPQPETAGETGVAADPIAEAANAFKTNFDQPTTERQLPPRAEDGKFTKAEQQIEAEEEAEPVAGEAETEAESQEEPEATDEAAEEAQPEAVDLPPSWPAELAEEWNSLPAPLQDKIVQREAEREAAVNAKFQEAANVRKANEALITEAQSNRQRFAEASDFVLSLIQPQKPSATMLNPQSGDYNPDAYHLAMAQYQEQIELVTSIATQRQQVAQQQAQEEAGQFEARRAEIEDKFGPLLLRDVPDLAAPEKQTQALEAIARYAVENGVPAETFSDPDRAKCITSADLRIAWKAMKYDEMMAAKAKVQPKAPKPTAPVVRPGVATSKSAVENSQRKKAIDRLNREGSVEAGAAIFKTIFKG